MTVENNTSRNQYTATSGQTVFAYTFEIVDKDDIVVLKNGTILSEGTDYAVSGVGTDSGGNVTLTVGASTSDVLTLYRDMPYARTQNYTNSGDFLASEVNSDFDNLWLAGEQTNRSFEQSVRKPITDSDSVSMELPEASSRANKLLGFDATGAVSTSLVTGDAQTIAGIADDIETLAHIQDGTVATDAITNVNTIRTDVTAVSGVASDVTAVAGNATNINTVATDLTGADDIGTVAGSIANVDTVAGDIANVNSVAGNSTNINTVATDLAGDDDIGTVASGISAGYVKTVALISTDVTAVAGNATNINTVASNISNVNAVGGVSSDVTTVAGISTEVTAVSSNATNINTVGTNITNVNNVGSNIANVNTVAGLETEINAVVADEADIGVVGANITSVNTVSSNINSVNAVSNNMADVNNAAANATAAAASAADANTSAGAAATSASAASTSASNASSSESAALTSANNASQSAATASLSASAAATSATNASSSAANAATSESNADDSETAAAISASNASSSASTASNNAIAAASSATSASNSASQAASSASAAATSATNSETAADTWNSYYSTYLGASATAPSYDLLGQPLQNGALYFNTTDDTMYVYNGSIWIAAESTINIVSVPTQLAANLTTNGNDIIFGDGDKAVFGAGSDLQIYHDGSGSYIDDVGTGNLFVRADSLQLRRANGSQLYLAANTGAEVALYHAGNSKLATTSTGIDVNGTVSADGLTVANTGTPTITIQDQDGTNQRAFLKHGAGNTTVTTQNGTSHGQFQVLSYNGTNTINRINVSSGGDVSFYEDTGTTAKFVWKSADERLGIGTTSPFRELEVTGTGNVYARITAPTASDSTALELVNTGETWTIANDDTNSDALEFRTSGGTHLTVDTSGNVGIGTSSPSSALHARGGSTTTPATASAFLTNATARLVVNHSNEYGAYIGYVNSSNDAIAIQSARSNGTTGPLSLNTFGGNVGIGTSSPATDLDVAGGTSSSAFTLSGRSDSSGLVNVGNIYGRNQNAGFNGARIKMDVSNTAGNIQFQTATGGTLSEAMRIDSSGDLLVGKTSGSLGTAGVAAYGAGLLRSTRSGNIALELNRTTSDGDIAQFKKDSATVGSIGSQGGANIYLTSGNRGVRLNDGDFSPITNANVYSDSTVDLGRSSARFKDLYLSGGAYLGGTAAANKLDDYEEGTWTPTLIGSGAGSATIGSVSGATYTKIGNLVHVRAYCSSVDLTNSTISGNVKIGGLPFSAVFASGKATVYYSDLFTASPVTTGISGFMSGSNFTLRQGSSNTTFTDSDFRTTTTAAFMVDVTYITES